MVLQYGHRQGWTTHFMDFITRAVCTEGIYFNTGLTNNFFFFWQEDSVQYLDNYISYLELHFDSQQEFLS